MSGSSRTVQSVNRSGNMRQVEEKAVMENLWRVVYRLLFRLSPACCAYWRNGLLRLFGARIGRNVYIAPTVRIVQPWNLEIADETQILDRAVLECTAPIHIGAKVLIERHAQMCSSCESSIEVETGPQPIYVEAEAVLGADSFVGPGVRIGPGTIVRPRASVFLSLPGWVVADGSPAQVVEERKDLRGKIRLADTSVASSGTVQDSPPPQLPVEHP